MFFFLFNFYVILPLFFPHSFQILSAVDGGGGKTNRFLRAAMRRAIELEYDSSKAKARGSALLLAIIFTICLLIFYLCFLSQ